MFAELQYFMRDKQLGSSKVKMEILNEVVAGGKIIPQHSSPLHNSDFMLFLICMAGIITTLWIGWMAAVKDIRKNRQEKEAEAAEKIETVETAAEKAENTEEEEQIEEIVAQKCEEKTEAEEKSAEETDAEDEKESVKDNVNPEAHN